MQLVMNKMITAMFINAGNDSEEAGNANISSFPPLGIISMATKVKNDLKDAVNVVLLDGQIDSCKSACETIYRLTPDVLFISMYCTGIQYAINCAKAGRESGALVVLGNDHAMAHYDTLLQNIPDIDLISLEEYGELSCSFICKAVINHDDLHRVPNSAFLDNGTIHVNGLIDNYYSLCRRHPFDNTPLPNRQLLGEKYWECYLRNFKKVQWKYCDKSQASGVTTMNRARGCSNVNHRCAYCGIRDLSIQYSSAHSFWEDIRNAQQEVHADFFYECFDNFTSSRKYMKGLLDSMPDDLGEHHLCVYSSANQINHDTCHMLKDLGVYLVNLGLDSADEIGLRALKGLNTSVLDNYRAVDILSTNELEMHVSFVLMGMGSNHLTRLSMRKTMDFIKYLVDNTSVTIIDCALFYPDRTAPVGGLIWHPENYQLYKSHYNLDYIKPELLEPLNKKWKGQVYIDSAEITKDFASLCGTDYELLLEYQKEIKELCDKHMVSFGYSQAGKLD